MYSLVSAAVLAQDLLRHPYAARLAEVVDRVLSLTPQEIAALGAPAPDQVRRRVLAACAAAARPHPPHQPGTTGTERERAVDVLDGALMGSVEDLHRLLLREDPLRAAGADAAQVALDAVSATWAGPAASLSDVGLLMQPWDVALPPVGPPLAVGGAPLRDLLDAVVRRTPEQWERTVASHVARRRVSKGWSTAMHEACRVAWQSDRLREVARAQLAAVRALALAGVGALPVRSDAEGGLGPQAAPQAESRPAASTAIAMSVTAAVQALCTADVLDERTRTALLSDWEAGQ